MSNCEPGQHATGVRGRWYKYEDTDRPTARRRIGNAMWWRRLQYAFLTGAIALAGLAAVSFVHPLMTTFSPTENRVYHVTIDDGNLRVIRVSADVADSKLRRQPFDKHVLRRSTFPTAPLAWSTRRVTLHDRIGRCELAASCTELSASLTLFAPLLTLLVLLFVARPLVREPWRLKAALNEILRPSDHHWARSFRRVIRRSSVALSGVGVLLTAGLWVASYTGLPSMWRLDVSWSCGHLWMKNARPLMIRFRPSLDREFWLVAGNGQLACALCAGGIARNSAAPTRDVQIGRFRWAQNASCAIQGWGGIIRNAARSLAFPCWAPLLVTLSWPVMAFIRGPWRRSGRRARGLCLRCGYNLTGLVEPRCPECGTPTAPGQVPVAPAVGCYNPRAGQAVGSVIQGRTGRHVPQTAAGV